MAKTTGKSTYNNKEKYAEPCSSHSKDFLIGGLIGGLIGAAAALLLAPKSGKELRSDLASTEGGQYICHKANELKQSVAQKSEELTEQYKAATTEISEKVAEQYSLICENINTLKQTLIDAQAEVIEEIEEELEEEMQEEKEKENRQ